MSKSSSDPLPSQEQEKHDRKECSGCGRKIPKTTRFCRECGAAQTRDAFLLLVLACLAVIGAVVAVAVISGPYSLTVNIIAPILTLAALAAILSLLLWR